MHTHNYEPEEFRDSHDPVDILRQEGGAKSMIEAVAARVTNISDELVKEMLAADGIKWDGQDLKALQTNLDAHRMELISSTEGDFITGRVYTLKLVQIVDQRKFKFTTKVDLGG